MRHIGDTGGLQYAGEDFAQSAAPGPGAGDQMHPADESVNRASSDPAKRNASTCGEFRASI
jgi:hypothetical protein